MSGAHPSSATSPASSPVASVQPPGGLGPVGGHGWEGDTGVCVCDPRLCKGTQVCEGPPGVRGTPRCVRDPCPGLTCMSRRCLSSSMMASSCWQYSHLRARGRRGVTQWALDLCGSPGATPSPTCVPQAPPGATPSPTCAPSPTCVPWPHLCPPAPPVLPAQVSELLPLLLRPFQVLLLLQAEPPVPVGVRGHQVCLGGVEGQRSRGQR